LFKFLHKSNKLKLSEARRPQEVGKTDDPSYYSYHKMLLQLMESCYILKDVLQALIDADVLKLRPDQKKVTANMTFLTPFQFGRDLPLSPIGVIPIPKGELRVINIDPHNKKEKGLVLVLTPQGEIMWVHLDLIKSQQWTTVTNRKSKGKRKAYACNGVCISSREAEIDIASITDSEEEEVVLTIE